MGRFFYLISIALLIVMKNSCYQTKNTGYSDKLTYISKWSPRIWIDVHEIVDHYPYVYIDISKDRSQKWDKPKSSTYQKVKPILCSIFDDYYKLTIQNLIRKKPGEGEFYLISNNTNSTQLLYYWENGTNSTHLSIDISDHIDYFSITVYNSIGHKGRAQARKQGTLISQTDFLQYFNLTIRYLSDHESLLILKDAFIKNILDLVNGDKPSWDSQLNFNASYESIINQLEIRVKSVQDRLINNDMDSKDIRAQLRGELDGIKYAIETIKSNQ